jgi:hypothetical protein
MSFDYSVAIKLSIANLASQGLKLFERDLLGANIAATKLQDKIKGLKLAAVGFGLEKAGSGIFGFLEKSIDASKEYTRQLSLMNAAGMTQRDIAIATTAAWQTSRDVLTTTAADNLKAARELRSVLGPDSMGEVSAILPTVQRMKGILEALTGKAQDGVAFDMVKAIELRTPGVVSPAAIQKNADLMSRSLMAFGGTLNVNDFHLAMKQLKNNALGLSDEFVYDYLPTFIQEAKTKGGSGSSAATALRTMLNTMVAGVGITKSSIPLWLESGLIKQSDVVRNATGQFQLKPGALNDSALLQSNPLKWAEKDGGAILSLALKHGWSVNQTVDALVKNTNAQWALSTLLLKQPQFERDRKLVESGGTSIETYQKLLKTNPQLAQQALDAQWQNVLSILGFQILPRLIPYMVKFADALDGVSQWMAKNGQLTQTIAFGLAGMGIALSVIGKVMLTVGIIKFLGLGSSIASVAESAGKLSLVLGKAGLVGAAAAAGFAIGELINRLGPDGDLGGWIGRKVYDLTHPNGGVIDAAHPAPKINTIVGKGGSALVVHTHVNLDGQKVAENTTHHQAKALNGEHSSTDRHDSTMSLVWAGGGLALP